MNLGHIKDDIFYVKIHDNEKHRPGLNKQLYAQGSSFLLL